MARPPRVSIRARKPILRIRFRRCGLYVGLMTKNWKKREKMEIGWGGCQAWKGLKVKRMRYYPENTAASSVIQEIRGNSYSYVSLSIGSPDSMAAMDWMLWFPEFGKLFRIDDRFPRVLCMGHRHCFLSDRRRLEDRRARPQYLGYVLAYAGQGFRRSYGGCRLRPLSPVSRR
jgi:hypothetical protein